MGVIFTSLGHHERGLQVPQLIEDGQSIVETHTFGVIKNHGFAPRFSHQSIDKAMETTHERGITGTSHSCRMRCGPLWTHRKSQLRSIFLAASTFCCESSQYRRGCPFPPFLYSRKSSPNPTATKMAPVLQFVQEIEETQFGIPLPRSGPWYPKVSKGIQVTSSN